MHLCDAGALFKLGIKVLIPILRTSARPRGRGNKGGQRGTVSQTISATGCVERRWEMSN